MLPDRLKLNVLLIFLLVFCGVAAPAQPILPDIQGSVKSRVVTIAWSNPYDNIKKITIVRSSDSVSSFVPIGLQKKPVKGPAEFVDEHPMPGNNYYKLSIVFGSGLTWSSNHCSVYIERSELEAAKTRQTTALPPNINLATTEPVKLQAPVPTDSFAGKREVLQPSANRTPVAIVPDTMMMHPPVQTPMQIVHHPKVNIAFDDPNTGPATFIKSSYIFVDTLSGHVDMQLPDDVATHHYSIKFYDPAGNMIYDVPRLHHSRIIFDRRNFQHKGIYKFVMRRDVVELESGYVKVE